jgi:DNA-directed RNA polymerase subunit RPC12/RpoP
VRQGRPSILISCPECSATVSDKAHVCPHCGFRIDTLIKCPDCGKLVRLGTAACPDCGYPFAQKPPGDSVVNGASRSHAIPEPVSKAAPTGCDTRSRIPDPPTRPNPEPSREKQYQSDPSAFVVAPNGDVIVPLSLSPKDEEFPTVTSSGKTRPTRRPLKLGWMRKLIIPAIAVLILCLLLRPQPLTYHVASIDPRFGARQVSIDGLALPAQAQDSTLGLPESVIESILQDAANRWNVALKKTAVRIDAGTAGYAVNFVFDYRQEYKNSVASINVQYSDLGNAKTAIDQEENSLESEKSRLDQEYASLNGDVAYWNSKGGATGTTYDSLVARRKAYGADVQALKQRETAYGQRVSAYKARLAEYKKVFAQAEATFKLAGGSTGENTVGTYDPNDRSITVYSYASSQDLRLIFMHELGHALGCGHASTPGSIMYSDLTNAQNLADPMPTAEDLALVGGS